MALFLTGCAKPSDDFWLNGAFDTADAHQNLTPVAVKKPCVKFNTYDTTVRDLIDSQIEDRECLDVESSGIAPSDTVGKSMEQDDKDVNSVIDAWKKSIK